MMRLHDRWSIEVRDRPGDSSNASKGSRTEPDGRLFTTMSVPPPTLFSKLVDGLRYLWRLAEGAGGAAAPGAVPGAASCATYDVEDDVDAFKGRCDLSIGILDYTTATRGRKTFTSQRCSRSILTRRSGQSCSRQW